MASGLLDFLGNLFGGGQQQPQPAGGLTNPDLYAQEGPPEFKLPFAYKLAMLGSSINRSYGGKGGMDIGPLAQAYLQSQQDQYTWQTEQAEKRRKIDLAKKYAEKTGNTDLMYLIEADPEAAIKHIFGVEAEKAKPQPVHNRPTATVENPDGSRTIVYTDTGEVAYETPKPEKRDRSYLVGGGASVEQPAAAPVPSVGAGRAAAGDVAPGATATADTVAAPVSAEPVPATVAPVSGFPDIDLTGVSESGVKTIQTLKSNLDRMIEPFDNALNALDRAALDPASTLEDKDYFTQRRELLTQRKDAIDRVYDDMTARAEEDRKAQATVKAAEVAAENERKAPSVAEREFKYRAGLPPDQQAAFDAYKAGPLTLERQVDYLNSLPDAASRKAAMEVLRSAAPAPVDKFMETLDVEGAKTWGEYEKAASNAYEISSDLAELDKLVKSGKLPEGGRFDPMSPLTSVMPWLTDETATFSGLISGIAPRMRVPGSGTTSDKDFDRFLASLPSLMNSPTANRKIIAILQKRYQFITSRAEIVAQVRSRDMTREEGFKALRDLNKTMGKAIPDDVMEEIKKDPNNAAALAKMRAADAAAGDAAIVDQIEKELGGQ